MLRRPCLLLLLATSGTLAQTKAPEPLVHAQFRVLSIDGPILGAGYLEGKNLRRIDISGDAVLDSNGNTAPLQDRDIVYIYNKADLTGGVPNFGATPIATATVSQNDVTNGKITLTATSVFTQGTYTLVAISNSIDSAFVNWTEGGTPVSTAASYTFVLGKNRTLVANFTTLPTLKSITMPSTITGGTSVNGTVTLSKAAPPSGVVVTLNSSKMAVLSVPVSVTVPAGQSSASFIAGTTKPSASTKVTVSASYNGTTKSVTVTVK